MARTPRASAPTPTSVPGLTSPRRRLPRFLMHLVMVTAIALPAGIGLTVAQPASADAASSCVYISGAKFNARGDDRKNVNGEYVKVRSKCKSMVNIRGWKLKDKAGNTYTFPYLRMGSGGTVYVHTGKGKSRPGHRYWGRSIPTWNNTGEKATLHRKSGKRRLDVAARELGRVAADRTRGRPSSGRVRDPVRSCCGTAERRRSEQDVP